MLCTPSIKINNQTMLDKKKILREQGHLTRPPRLEGVVKNKNMNPVKKKKRKFTTITYQYDQDNYQRVL